MLLNAILESYGIKDYTINEFGLGLINDTWVVENKSGIKKFILQRINTNVFTSPENISLNIRLIENYLKQHKPQYLLQNPW